MGQRWKWSISEVFLQIIVGGVGPLPHGKYGAHIKTEPTNIASVISKEGLANLVRVKPPLFV